MIYKKLLLSQANEIAQLLQEYVVFRNKLLHSAGTFSSLFKDIDFSTLYKEIDTIKINFERKEQELKEVKEEYYGNFADISMEFFDTLESYFIALFEAVKQLNLLSFRLYETSKGFIGNQRKLSWSEYSKLTKACDKKHKRYIELGDKLNRAYQALKNESDDFIDDEVEETGIISVLGIDIDNIMYRNLYDWAQTNQESLEDQIVRHSKNAKDIEQVIDFLEKKLAYRGDKWEEIEKIITGSLPRVIKEELIYNVISRSEQPIVILSEKIDPDNMPKLYQWAKNNPETLRSQLISLAKLPGGSIMNAMQSLESDLKHG